MYHIRTANGQAHFINRKLAHDHAVEIATTLTTRTPSGGPFDNSLIARRIEPAVELFHTIARRIDAVEKRNDIMAFDRCRNLGEAADDQPRFVGQTKPVDQAPDKQRLDAGREIWRRDAGLL